MRGRRFLAAIAFGAATIIQLGPSAHAVVLDFSGNICGGGSCENAEFLDAGYGSVPGQVAVSYERNILDAIIQPQLSFWTGGYGDLTAVAWGGVSGVGTAQVFITPLGGQVVRLNSFDLAREALVTSQYTIRDGFDKPLASWSGTLPAGGHLHVTFNLVSSSGIKIQWGPAWNVGIDNINFAVESQNAVPLPAAFPLFATGLGVLGLLGWRRKRKVRAMTA